MDTYTACCPAGTDWLSGWGGCVLGSTSHWYETVPADPLVLIRPVTTTPHPSCACCVMAAPVT
jgi:hypothetical protein